MAYSTITAVRQAIVPGDWDPDGPPSHTAADLPSEQISDSIDEADTRIDFYVGGRYQTPLGDPPPAPVGVWSRDIAAYLALLVWRGNQNVEANEPLVLRYSEVLAELVAVRDGKTDLNLPGSDFPSAGGGTPYNMIPAGLMSVNSGLDPFGPSWPGTDLCYPAGIWWPR